MGAERVVKRFKKRFVGGRVPTERIDTLQQGELVLKLGSRDERERKIADLKAEIHNLTLSPKRRNRARAKLQALLGRKD